MVTDGLLLDKLMTVMELKIHSNYENIANQILQIRNHKNIVKYFNIHSIYIVLGPLQICCCMKATKFHEIRMETFCSISFLPNIFKMTFDYFPLGKLLMGNEEELIFLSLNYITYS